MTQRYRLGFNRETTTIEDKKGVTAQPVNDSVPMAKDTIVTEEFVPVTSFIHTIKVERTRHQFTSATETAEQYPDAFSMKPLAVTLQRHSV